MTFTDRYREVGLERNPFCTAELVERRVFLHRGLPNPPPPGSRTMVQVVGDRGYGKSTHLAIWRAAQPGPYHYVPPSPYRSRWSAPPALSKQTGSTTTIYGDEIDRMPSVLRRRWLRKLARSEATVVIGTHTDLSAVATRAGFTVVTHWLEPFTKAELRNFLALRVDAVTIALPGDFALTDDDVEQIYSASRGVPREAEDQAHRLIADRVGQL